MPSVDSGPWPALHRHQRLGSYGGKRGVVQPKDLEDEARSALFPPTYRIAQNGALPWRDGPAYFGYRQ